MSNMSEPMFYIEDGMLSKYFGNEKHVDIPEGVEFIPERIFYGKQVESVYIPRSVRFVSRLAFYDCNTLKEVTFDADCDVALDWQAFGGIYSLEKVTLPKRLNRIRRETFLMCWNLKSIRIPDGVKRIGPSAFDRCEKLEEVILPDGLEMIFNRAFSNCESLKRIVIPDSVRYIGEHAFSECKAFEEVHLPEALEEMENMAFFNCGLRGEVRIPSHVRRITSNCFFYCKNLEKISYPASSSFCKFEDFRRIYAQDEKAKWSDQSPTHENNAENVNAFESPFEGCDQAIVEAY